MPQPCASMKSVKFPGFQDVAGVDQGYAPLHFRTSMIEVRDRRGKRQQRQFLFGFKPDEEELAQLKAGGTLYLSIWHDVIPPMRLEVGLSKEDLDAVVEITAIPDQPGYDTWSKIQEDFKVHVFLDGIEQLHCAYANRNKGHVVRAITDDKGAPVRKGEEWLSEDVYGDVRFEFERIDR